MQYWDAYPVSRVLIQGDVILRAVLERSEGGWRERREGQNFLKWGSEIVKEQHKFKRPSNFAGEEGI